MPTTISIKAIDMFYGIGGLSYGLQMAGVPVAAGLDRDQTCRYPYTENCNADFIHADVKKSKYSDISSYLDGVSYRVLVGCAPCQPFSNHAIKKGESRRNDTRWNLINELLRFVIDGSPEIVSMENVPLRRKEIFISSSKML